ncbi:MAG: hypothetical protein EB084_23235 [Proteobacteria bacterium]|nr:hypothetical protein [Pseudomonadota bacterium]
MQIPNVPPYKPKSALTVARSEADGSPETPQTPGRPTRATNLVDGRTGSDVAEQALDAKALAELRAGTPVGQVPTSSLQAWFNTAARFADNTYYGRNNLDGTLAWLESEVVEGYLEAYEATKNTKYLDKVSRHLDKIVQLRDSAVGWKDYRGLSLPAWQSTKYDIENKPGIWAVHTGIIAHGLAKFAALVKHDNLSAYQTKADAYLQAARSALAVHDDEFVTQGDAGFYIARKGFPIATDGVNLPTNMNLAMALAHLAVYQASGDAAQLERATRIARTVQGTLTPTSTGGCTWHYTFDQGFDGWGPGTSTHTPSSTGNRTVEDTSHGALDVQAISALHEAGVVFTDSDMQRLGSQLERVVLKTDVFPAYIDGSGTSANPGKVASWSDLSHWSPSVSQHAFDQLMQVPLAPGKVPPWAMRGMALLLESRAHASQ